MNKLSAILLLFCGCLTYHFEYVFVLDFLNRCHILQKFSIERLYFRQKCQHGLSPRDRQPIPTPPDPNNKTKLVALPSTVSSSTPVTPAITVDTTTLKEKVLD